MGRRDGEYDLGQNRDFHGDEIDLIALFQVVWRKRLIITVCTIMFACVSFFVVLKKALVAPVSSVSQEFSLKFIGIDENKYPNGIDFNIADITTSQVVAEVYERNNLIEYGLTLQELRDNLIVNKSVQGLIALEGKYKALLDQKGLTAEERQLLQQEYQDQRSKLFKSPFYSIAWVSNTQNVPVVVQEKVILDTLSQWAKNSEEHKGVFLYQVPVITQNAFYFENVDDEYIIKVDMLRYVVTKIKSNLAEIEKLPGALIAVTRSGNKLTSLQLRVNDLLNYQIAPLTGLIRSGGLYVNKELALIYTKEQLYNLELKKGMLQGEMALLSDALDGYINSNDQFISRKQRGDSEITHGSTIIPQIGDRFLDQLVAMANDNQDVVYRQNITTKIVAVGTVLLKVEKDISYYQELLKSREGKDDKANILLVEFKRKNKRALTEARDITNEMTELYQLISESYLNVSDKLYQLNGPLQSSSNRAVSLKKTVLVYGASVIVFFCLSCFCVLLMSVFGKNTND